jgi:histidinol-phosphatase
VSSRVPSQPDPDPADLELALSLADAADAALLAGFGDPGRVRHKADGSPVSDVDEEVEGLLRAGLAAARPGEAVLGEEEGDAGRAPGGRRWVLDPVDGTKNFLRRSPVFACLIALEAEGSVQLGVCSAPALGRRWWAVRGAGAWAGGTPIRVSETADLAEAELLHSGLGAWRRHGRLDAFLALEAATGRTRGYGDFWPFMLVAEGVGDLAVEPGGLKWWDVAAPAVIVEEAGGRITGLAGDPLGAEGSVLASNGRLHATAAALMAARPPADHPP